MTTKTSVSVYGSKIEVLQPRDRGRGETPLYPTDVGDKAGSFAPTEQDIDKAEDRSDVLLPTSAKADARDAERKRETQKGERRSGRRQAPGAGDGGEREEILMPTEFNR